MALKIFAVFLANLFFMNLYAQTSVSVNIIPKPVSLKVKPGVFKLDKNTIIVVKDDGDKDAAYFFNDYLKKYYGFSLNITDAASNNFIIFST
jgi:hexosaminidase